jgi:hypothetical protein
MMELFDHRELSDSKRSIFRTKSRIHDGGRCSETLLPGIVLVVVIPDWPDITTTVPAENALRVSPMCGWLVPSSRHSRRSSTPFDKVLEAVSPARNDAGVGRRMQPAMSLWVRRGARSHPTGFSGQRHGLLWRRRCRP